jgi:hypothetical protein
VRVYVFTGWAGGGLEVAGDEAQGLALRRRSATGEVLAERRLAPSREAWRRFAAALAGLGVWGWEPRYEPEYPVCGGAAWAVRLEGGGGRLRASGEDAYPPNWSGFWRALEALVGRPLEEGGEEL